MEELRGLPVANAINEKLIEQIKDIAAIATPVPGGVGSVTTSVLAKHLVSQWHSAFSHTTVLLS